MIQEVKMYTVICDNCGKDVCEGEEYSCWSDGGFAKDIAMDFDWITEDDKHYCREFYSYNDEDELVIDQTRTKPKP